MFYRNLRSRLVRCVEWIMGGASDDPTIRRRQYVLTYSLCTFGLLGTVIWPFVFWANGLNATTLATTATLGLVFPAIWLLRRSDDPTLAASLTLVGLSAALFLIALLTRGMDSSALFWLVVMPALAPMLVRRSLARWFVALLCVGLLGLFALEHVRGGVVDTTMLVIDLVCAITAILGTHFVAAHGERVHSRMRKEIRRREVELQEARRAEALGRMAGGVAHDFNNLMTVVSAQSALMRMDAPGPELQESLDSLDDVVKESHGLTSRLLEYLSRGQHEMVKIDPARSIAALEDELRQLAGDGVDLEVHSDLDGARVEVNEVQCRRALRALVRNSREAMPDGGMVSITLREEPADGRPGVAVYVSDTGTGMPPEVRERAFEPFFTTKEMARGTGLGLSSVRGIVRQVGGEIDLESTVGEGTTVRVWLPAHRPDTLDESEDSLDLSPSQSQDLIVALPVP